MCACLNGLPIDLQQRYIMLGIIIFKIIILHMVDDNYMLLMFIMEESHMFVLHLVKMY
jgi:hypothetical protein